jgi:predicted DNA-binding transcriptional regulator AlpA
MISHSENELLKVEQFAQRLQVSRTTVFGWLKNGDLQEGVHYLRLGRILRFRWPFFLTDQPLLQTDKNVECKSHRSVRDLPATR